jgi:hypothetical protein
VDIDDSSSIMFWRFYRSTWKLGLYKDWDISGFLIHEWIAKWKSGRL